MKQLQVTGGREFVVSEAPMPEPGPGEVRVKVEAVTICAQWDLHLRHNDPMYLGHQFVLPYTPGQPGHEASGVVDMAGPGVVELAEGDRVSIWRDPGHDIPGCYAQYVVRPIHDVILVPDRLAPWESAPVELAMCVACSVLRLKQARAISGKRLAVMGLGPAGLIALQMLKAEGAAFVAGIDPSPERREIGLDLGLTAAMSPEEAERALPLRPKAQLDSAIDCVGLKKTVEFVMDRVEDAVALFGVQREDYAFRPSHWLGLRLLGYAPHSREAAEYAVSLLAEGKLDLGSLVTHRMPLEHYGEAVDLLEQQKAVKIALMPFE